MASLNKVQIIGRLGKDPEVRSTANGTTVTTINVATSEFSGKGPDRKEKTEWHRIVLWDKLGQIAGNYLKKGRQVFIEGKLRTREYVDKTNVKRYMTEIFATNMILLGGKEEGMGGGYAPAQSSPAQYGGNEPAPDFSSQDMDNYAASMQDLGGSDEVPF